MPSPRTRTPAKAGSLSSLIERIERKGLPAASTPSVFSAFFEANPYTVPPHPDPCQGRQSF